MSEGNIIDKLFGTLANLNKTREETGVNTRALEEATKQQIKNEAGRGRMQPPVRTDKKG